MFSDGQDKPEDFKEVWGSEATVTSAGEVLAQEGAVRLYEIVTPGKNTLQRNSRALKPWQRQEVLSDQTGSDCSTLAQESMG